MYILVNCNYDNTIEMVSSSKSEDRLNKLKSGMEGRRYQNLEVWRVNSLNEEMEELGNAKVEEYLSDF